MGFKVEPNLTLDHLNPKLFSTTIYIGYSDEEVHHSGMTAAALGKLMTEGDGNLVPARPHVEPGLAEAKQELRSTIRHYAWRILTDRGADEAAQKIGNVAREAVIDYVYSGALPENAPFTIEKKGSDQPLVEQGELLHMLEAKIVKGRL